ncbi:2-oxoglutarate dehydrogenase, mitochondrial [Zancudomyces culisetae]|uniref:2-oxoglutarate dehydrogenase, mitochondrial n=1 Tax=Zancudomyces culisetae TaxID=1213189 RepID=A0A1R1PWN8_ZANCU|nr:2-oxoglutarate dehydrogenase, mitochondrial [Zancudomyces culisetae]|eukprot:OMH85378.1 2-oxoglutarate dehydrogenase, mitochondrial [Zancudomyces culisetae]
MLGARKYGSAPSNENFLTGTSSPYVEEMYKAYLEDPQSVHSSWRAFFKNVDKGLKPGQAFAQPPTEIMSGTAIIPPISDIEQMIGSQQESQDGYGSVMEHLKVQLFVRAYQVRGHTIANLDPLGLSGSKIGAGASKELSLDYYGFTEADLDKKFRMGPGIFPYFIDHGVTELSLRDIHSKLQRIYCGTFGVEYTHMGDREMCNWFRIKLEAPEQRVLTKDMKRVILDRLAWGTLFERYSAKKYPSQKRFGLEGLESLIPGLKELIDYSVDLGVEHVVIGMPHRGRLNVLSNVVRKPNESIFCEFSGELEPSVEGSGDARYHLGMNFVRPTPNGKNVHLSLLANPSHLETIDPIVLGKTRALQTHLNDDERKKCMALLLHGDAAFAAQGIVYETLGFSELPGYKTGGTIHVIVNNQVGFTTDPRFARSTRYPSDIAKAIGAPIIHINADDPEAVVDGFRLASEWRQTFGKDVVIDLLGYRRHGHNETDQPMFTQPTMYKIIKNKKSSLETYSEKLIAEKSFTRKEIDQVTDRIWDLLDQSYARSKNYVPTSAEWVSSVWPGFKSLSELSVEITPLYPTGVSLDALELVGQKLCTLPSDFNLHPQLSKILAARAETLRNGAGIDWPTAEALAAGTLLLEGKGVRLSGQDVERGTFSQRHWVLHDQVKDTHHYRPLQHISSDQGRFTVSNSPLSEYGTLGFELGYSLLNPNDLVMWEAQFGDFANVAQAVVDQCISAGEKKWLQRTGLTMLLPHGFDGQGSEHSSARLERFLQMCDENPYIFPSETQIRRQHQDINMQVVYASTPANFFHVLRRQIHRDFRKPLIVMTSKKLLRHPLARSTLEEMTGDTHFQRFILDPLATESASNSNGDSSAFSLLPRDQITTHILCTGQVYYALAQARELNNLRHIAISRIEQLHPFPWDLVRDGLDYFPNASDIVWTQEEPLNMGAWTYVEPRLRTTFLNTSNHSSPTSTSLRYCGRAPSGPVATGNIKQHFFEEWTFVSQALYGSAKKPSDVINGVPKWD